MVSNPITGESFRWGLKWCKVSFFVVGLHCKPLQWKCSGSTVKWLQCSFDCSEPLHTLFHCNWLEVKTANIVETQMHSFLQWHDCKNHKYVMRFHCCLKIMQILKIWKCSLQSSLITKTTLWSLILTKNLLNYTDKNCNYCRSSSAILFTVAWL